MKANTKVSLNAGIVLSMLVSILSLAGCASSKPVKDVPTVASTRSVVTVEREDVREDTNDCDKNYGSGRYSDIQDIICRGNELLRLERYDEAVRQYDYVINRGYRNADIYMRRACANVLRDYLFSAIEDCYSAISYDKRNIDAWCLLGLCKITHNDYSGVNDLRRAGERGANLLKKMGLYDYYPPQYKQYTPSTPSKTQRYKQPAKTSKPTPRKQEKSTLRQETERSVRELTKDPNFKIFIDDAVDNRSGNDQPLRPLTKNPNLNYD